MSVPARYTRLGFSDEYADPAIHLDSLQSSLEIEETPDLVWSLHSERVYLAHWIALDYFLADSLSESRMWAERAVSFAETYFFGEWRDRTPTGNRGELQPDRAWWNVHASWSTQFTAAFVWCAVLNCWERLERICTYVIDDIQLDVDQTPANRAWLQYVAGVQRQRPKIELQPMVDVIHGQKSKKERFLLAWMMAIEAKEAFEIQKAAGAYGTYFLKNRGQEMRGTKPSHDRGVIFVSSFSSSRFSFGPWG